MPAPLGDLVVIAGPTASGKSRMAAAIAEKLDTEVVNADARQFYHALRIGAALPTQEEMRGVHHHYVGHLEVNERMSAGAYARAAVPVLEALLARKGVAVLSGGSGLYLNAVLRGFDALPEGDPQVRERLGERLRIDGLLPLVAELRERDPATWERIDRNNPQRVLRALELCELAAGPVSALRTGGHVARPWNAIMIVLDLPREVLYARIAERVDRMLADGLEKEARALLPHRHENALKTVGYTELFQYFDGTIDRSQAIALIEQHTRNYAKRQLTWFRRDTHWAWLPPQEEVLLAHIASRRANLPRSG